MENQYHVVIQANESTTRNDQNGQCRPICETCGIALGDCMPCQEAERIIRNHERLHKDHVVAKEPC